jgi:8-oxo-dGTP diphosphatase
LNSTPSPIRVLAAVIRRGDDYLICQRPHHKRHGGLWEFPGGKLEPDESILDAARRELLEELGVTTMEVHAPLLAVADPGSVFVIEFVPTVIEGDPTCLEHAALRWAPLPDLPALPLAPSDRRFVEFLLSS